jgi:hypothetical protein
MEDKLLNRIINQHLKNLSVTRNTQKHTTNFNDNITSVTTASISRETSDVLLKKENIITSTVTSFKKQHINLHSKQPSKSQDKIVINKNQVLESKEIYTKKHININSNKKTNMGINAPTQSTLLKMNLNKNRTKSNTKDLRINIKSEKVGVNINARKSPSGKIDYKYLFISGQRPKQIV